jgi:aspartyl-tRNA(Asn)/glutamyl-tRNA(Gln) amidotransferase subunit A
VGRSRRPAARAAARAAPSRRAGAAGARLRHRRLDPQPASLLRRRRPEADLRPRLALRLLAFASSLDQIGPFARTVAARALALGVDGRPIAPTPRVARAGARLRAALTGDVQRLRVGVPRTFVTEGVDADVRRVRRRARGARERRRAARATRAAARAATAIPVYYLGCTAEASSNLARYDGVKYGYRSQAPRRLQAMYTHSRSEVRRRGQAPDHARHLRAERRLLRRVLSEGAAGAHAPAPRLRARVRGVDVIAMPTSPIPPFRLGEKRDDPLQMYLADIFTVSANSAGVPAISVPGGFVQRGATSCRSGSSSPRAPSTRRPLAGALMRTSD